ncbi:hypothetical protein HaLaN_18374 [Haematococcus lacustris]|uniref:Uncharacterized protein n=1 Tax=Haematococcus lacustris TaxID=44745 RepID=A0A699ZEV5_HAELA|nr:hypothetical protein HaLaN_18374 [Haematococcus lacustris]
MWVRWPVTSRQPTAASTTGAAASTGPPASMAWQRQGRCGAPRRHGKMLRPAASHPLPERLTDWPAVYSSHWHPGAVSAAALLQTV